MIKNNFYKLVAVAILLLACDKKNVESSDSSSTTNGKGNLELSLITPEVLCLANGNFRDINNQIDYSTDKVYDSISRNIIKSKLTNNSDKKYFIVLNEDYVEEIEDDKAMNALSAKKIEKKNSYSLNLYQGNQILEGNITLVMGSYNQRDNRNSWIMRNAYFDSTFVANTNKKKIYGSEPASTLKREVLNHSFVLHPGETKYFTSVVNLPYRKGNVFWLSAVDRMKPDNASLTLVNKAVYTKEHLSEDQKKEIQENGYTIFDGILQSNKVPVKMISIPKSMN